MRCKLLEHVKINQISVQPALFSPSQILRLWPTNIDVGENLPSREELAIDPPTRCYGTRLLAHCRTPSGPTANTARPPVEG